MNSYAVALQITGWLVIAVGTIGSFVLGDSFSIGYSYNVPLCVAGIVSSVIFGVILLGLSEIINLLDINRNYLKKLADSTDTIIENSSKNSNMETYNNNGYYNNTPDYNNYDLPEL